VGQIAKDERERLFDFTYLPVQSSRFICDRLWVKEVDSEHPDFPRLDRELEQLEIAAEEIDARVLTANIARARIVVAASYETQIEKAVGIANLAIQKLNNPYAEFLLAFTLGTACTDVQDWERAIFWLSRAISALNREGAAQIPEFVVRAYLSRAQAITKLGRSAEADCLKAVEYARRSDEVPELMLIKALAELSIARWPNDKTGFYQVWEEVVERTLQAKEDSLEWKGLFVINGNNGAYFSSMIKKQGVLQVVTEPFQGMYMLHSPRLPSLYTPETEWYIAATMVWLAESLGKFDEMSRWALRAIEMASGSSIGEQAKYLLVYAAPQMIRERRYIEALEFVLESTKGMQASNAPVAAFAESHGKEELLRVIRERKTTGSTVNTELLTLIMLPIVLDLACWRISNPEQAAVAAEDVAAKCRELGQQSTDVDVWMLAADRLGTSFSPIPRGEVTQQALHDSEDKKYLGALIGFAASADAYDPDQAFKGLYRSLEFFERQFDRSHIHMLLTAELSAKFWRTALIANPMGFRQPQKLNEKLTELQRVGFFRPRDVMLVTFRHLGLQVPPQVTTWLEASVLHDT
jgi:tetratricopeptide (TPR) repeat protein